MANVVKFLFINGILAIPLMFWFDVPFLSSFLTGALIGFLVNIITYLYESTINLIQKVKSISLI